MRMDFLKRPSVLLFLAFTTLYAICLGCIFGGTWSFDVAAIQPDAGHTFRIDQVARNWRAFLSGRDVFLPLDVTGLVCSPYFWHELRYAIAAYLAALGMAYYLRGRGLPLVAAYGGGSAYGLMGYSFTLFSAGHMGWFYWLMYGPFAFGLTDRAVRKGKVKNWLLLGAVLAWGMFRQPDMWLLFSVLTLAYGVWCIAREWRIHGAGTFAGIGGLKGMRGLLVGICVTMAMTCLIGMPAVLNAFTESLATRDRQIAESSSAMSRATGKNQTDSSAKSAAGQERWRFCTSWSLPPEDILEFAVPRINGDTSDVNIIELRKRAGWRETTPYTGRLGMPVPGPDGKPSRWMPYRQHSLYFGLITLAFAAYGLFAAMCRKDSNRGEVFFWGGSVVVTLFCAMGCFTPFYRLVYAMPFGGYLRAPVKFVHIVEFCVAALSGFGVAAILSRFSSLKPVFWIVVALLVANVVDLARIDALYVGPESIAFQRAANSAADDVRRLGGGKTAILVPPQEGGRAIGDSFNAHLAPTADLSAAGGDPMKTDAKYLFVSGSVFANTASLSEQLRDGRLRLVGTYSLSGSGIRSAPRNQSQAVLIEIPGRPAKGNDEPSLPPLRRVFNYVSIATTIAVIVWLAYVMVFRRRNDGLA